MATQGGLPYGLTDIMLEKLDATDTPVAGASVRLANGQTVDFTPNEDETTVEGYGVTVGTARSATNGDVSLQYAGIDIDAEALITGGTVVTTGVAPNVVQTLDMGVEGQARPYIRVSGKANGNNGGASVLQINKVRFGLPDGGFDHKAFRESTIAGTAVVPSAGANSGKLYQRRQYQTPVALVGA